MARKTKHEINIAEVDNGYIVRVGCKSLVFLEKSEMLHELDCYFGGVSTELSKSLMEKTAPEGPEQAGQCSFDEVCSQIKEQKRLY